MVTTKELSQLTFNQTNLKLWIDALRSGKYLQVIERLKTSDAYCCLGVLCEVSNLVRFELWNIYYYPVVISSDTKSIDVQPPPEVMKWLINEYSYHHHPDIITDFINILIRMNDTDKLNFNEIADFLEQFIEKDHDNNS